MAVKKKDKGQKKSKSKKDQKQKVDIKADLDKIRNPAMEKLYETASKENEQYKVRIENLIKTIDNLQETCRTQDHDALEVISTLQRESESKDTKIKLLEGQMDTERENSRLEKESIIKDYESQLADLRDALREKETSLKVIKDEFNVLKDFRRKRRELMQELERKNNDMIEIEKTNKDKIERLEKKFFEEKVRLQKETNKKLAELASKAHQEAILNLKQTTKEVYKENLRMADALRYHVMEGEDLQKLNNQLSITNKQLLEEKDLNSIIVKEKIMQSKKQNDQIKELQNKVMSMEYTLSHIVREFDQEKEIISKLAKQEIDKVRYTVDTLKSELDIRIKQMKQIRRIAQHILDQRTDLETFFMDALEQVRLEICREREEKRRQEAEEYNRKIRSVLNPRGNINEEESLNEEIEQQKLQAKKNSSKVDITQLSWKDKERVLRILFAKMNGIAMESSDGNEDNKITGGDYNSNEQMSPSAENNYNDNNIYEGEDVRGEEEEESESEDEEDEESFEEEGKEGKEDEDLHESDLESISDHSSNEKAKNQEDEDRAMIEKIKQQQEGNDKRIPSPHPPSDEPDNNSLSRNKMRNNSSHSHSSLLAALSNSLQQINDGDGGDAEDNNALESALLENMDENVEEEEEEDNAGIIESAKEIMKSDASLNQFIENGINDIKKSEEELRAQSEESFEEFLKRSYSQVHENTENENNDAISPEQNE